MTDITPTVAKVMRASYPSLDKNWANAYTWTQARVALKSVVAKRRPGGRNMDKVRDISAKFTAGEELPPIILVKEGDFYRLVDGWHRYLGAQHAGKKALDAYIGEPAWHQLYRPGGDAYEQEHVHKQDEVPRVFRAPNEGPYGGLFLAGPYSDHTWRGKVIDALREANICVCVYTPERTDFPTDPDSPEYLEQVDWEREHLADAELVAFWLPGSNPDAYGSRMELGVAAALDKEMIIGIEPGFPLVDYIQTYTEQRKVYMDFEAFIKAIIKFFKKYRVRKAGENMSTPLGGDELKIDLTPSPDLAYLCAVFNGDAWVEDVGSSKRLVVSARDHDKAFPEVVASVMTRIGLHPRFWFNNSKKLWMTHAVSKQFFNWITTLSDASRAALAHKYPLDYIRGAFESDGTTIDQADGSLSVRFTKKDAVKTSLTADLLKGQGWQTSVWTSEGAYYVALTQQNEIGDFLAKIKPVIKLPDGKSGGKVVGNGLPGAG